MTITIENPIVTPNVGMAQAVMFQTNIVNGFLQVQLVISYQAVKKTGDVWEDVGGKTKTIVISDILNLEPSLAHLQAGMDQIYDLIETGVAAINTVKKVL